MYFKPLYYPSGVCTFFQMEL